MGVKPIAADVELWEWLELHQHLFLRAFLVNNGSNKSYVDEFCEQLIVRLMEKFDDFLGKC